MSIYSESRSPNVTQKVLDFIEENGIDLLGELGKSQEVRDRDIHLLYPDKKGYLLITGNRDLVMVKIDDSRPTELPDQFQDENGDLLLYVKTLEEFIYGNEFIGILEASKDPEVAVDIQINWS